MVLASFLVLSTGCKYYSAGTLGSFEESKFELTKSDLEIRINKLQEDYPEYKVPPKREEYNDWEQRGYSFLTGYIFYFESEPEEMYYVTFLGDTATLANSTQSALAIRAIHQTPGRWLLAEDLTESDRRRVEERFNKEIKAKLIYY